MDGGWLRRWPWWVAGVAAVALAVWAFLPQPVEVDVAPVVRDAFEKTVDEDGKTRVRDRYVVSAPLAGRLLRIALRAGDAVERGTLIGVLLPSAPPLHDVRLAQELAERVGAAQAAKERAGADVERAQVAVALARSELERARNLAQQGFTSKQALERAERETELKAKELASARFDDHAAEHQLALARAVATRARAGSSERRAEERWEIRSPVAGVVLRLAQESEAVVASGAPLVDIGDARNLEVVVDVLTADAVLIRPGTEARLDRGPGTPPLSGRVRRVEPSAFTKVSALGIEEQRVNVVIDFVSPPAEWQDLGDAFRVDARIVIERRADAIVVPTGALFRHGQGWAVFVADAGRARLRVVEPGPRGGTKTVVLRGLDAGEQVIVYPADSVRDAVRVRPRERAHR